MLVPLDEITTPYSQKDYITIFTEQHDWDCNWKCLTENFMENYHLPVAHKATVGAHYVVKDTSLTAVGISNISHISYLPNQMVRRPAMPTQITNPDWEMA